MATAKRATAQASVGPARPVNDEAVVVDVAAVLHNTVYDELRWRMITGRVMPGIGLSTRGLAQELGVSQMPVREALARLEAERAIEIRSKRRITVPAMTAERFEDLLRCRLLLEPEAARLAFEFIDGDRLKRLKAFDLAIDAALRSGDVNAYMEGNFNFHFELYRAHQRPTLNQLIETLWLQFGPFMRVVYGRFGTAQLVDQHRVAVRAIEAGDREGLATAIYQDIDDGMGLIGRSGLT
jgi:DNA-binding GntR family transcriptional regulator